MFQSTRPHGARPFSSKCRRSPSVFQSTRPHGARLPGRFVLWKGKQFQSTRPHGARRGNPARTIREKSFNPRARMGRDGLEIVIDHRILVSIHAPAWGATREISIQDIRNQFQSTRPHGARPTWRKSFPWLSGFNPRARMGRDGFKRPAIVQVDRFNPRARMGRDGRSRAVLRCFTGFNPRARMGRDDQTAPQKHIVKSFNPRARMGRDRGFGDPPCRYCQFQSTRPHGARHLTSVSKISDICFNPRARMGRDELI